MRSSDFQPDKSNAGGELRIVLPGYRASYAPNDFRDLAALQTDELLSEHLVKQEQWPRKRAARRLVLQIPEHEADPGCELATVAAYRSLLRECEAQSFRKLIGLAPRSILLIAVGLSVLYLSNLLGEAELHETLRKTVSEATKVGGWVALWTAVALMGYDVVRVLNRMLAFRRLHRLPIEFEYQPSGEPERSQCQPANSAPRTDLYAHR